MLKGTVNHGGTLPKQYFISYLKLVMLSRGVSVLEAKEFTFKYFFRNDEQRFGPTTYEHFIQAYFELTDTEVE